MIVCQDYQRREKSQETEPQKMLLRKAKQTIHSSKKVLQHQYQSFQGEKRPFFARVSHTIASKSFP